MPAWTFRTLSTEDDFPIAGARVALGVRLGRAEGRLAVAETDGRGRCRLELELPEGWGRAVEVMVAAAGRNARRMVLDADPPPAPIALRLAPGPTIRGTVSDRDGRPVAGATVELRGAARRGSGRKEWYGASCWPPLVTTDAAGRYTVTWFSRHWLGQPEGEELAIAVDHPEFEPWERRGVQAIVSGRGDCILDARLEPRRGPARVTAEPAATTTAPEHRAPLRLAVVRGWRRRPVTQGRVWLSLVDAPRFSFWVPIEPDGVTAQRLVPAGTYRAQVTAPGWAARHAMIRVDATGACSPRALRTARGRLVCGRVTDEEGRPVAGCFVQFANRRARVTPEGRATTDDRGEYRLPGARGLCWFAFQARGFTRAGRIRWLAGWLPWKRRLDVVLPRGCAVAGRVAGADGPPRAALR